MGKLKEKKKGKKEEQLKWKRKRREIRKGKTAEEEMNHDVEAVIEIVIEEIDPIEEKDLIEEKDPIEVIEKEEIEIVSVETGMGIIEDQEVNVEDLEVGTEMLEVSLKEVPTVVTEMEKETGIEVTEMIEK